MTIRQLKEDEWEQVAQLIFDSTNTWYERNLNRKVFQGDASACRLFPEVYESLDPGCCLVAEVAGEMAGSCFYHPRETHVSLGIVNVDARFAGRGLARRLVDEVISRAEGRPLRLVSSAMNLDSYSLYTRLGFVPITLYQDMVFSQGHNFSGIPRHGVRAAEIDDLPAMVSLEEEINGIRREKDFRYFIENTQGPWHGSVLEDRNGLQGFLFSINHPASRMLGPGVMRSSKTAMALIATEAQRFEGEGPLILVPAEASDLIASLYAEGARNCELHVAQVLGKARRPKGITMPTFMPETG